MAEKLPLKWFPSMLHSGVAIRLRKVDRTALLHRQFKPFFDTWALAHNWMLERAENRLTKAEAELQQARAHLTKVKKLLPPTP